MFSVAPGDDVVEVGSRDGFPANHLRSGRSGRRGHGRRLRRSRGRGGLLRCRGRGRRLLRSRGRGSLHRRGRYGRGLPRMLGGGSLRLRRGDGRGLLRSRDRARRRSLPWRRGCGSLSRRRGRTRSLCDRCTGVAGAQWKVRQPEREGEQDERQDCHGADVSDLSPAGLARASGPHCSRDVRDIGQGESRCASEALVDECELRADPFHGQVYRHVSPIDEGHARGRRRRSCRRERPA